MPQLQSYKQHETEHSEIFLNGTDQKVIACYYVYKEGEFKHISGHNVLAIYSNYSTQQHMHCQASAAYAHKTAWILANS